MNGSDDVVYGPSDTGIITSNMTFEDVVDQVRAMRRQENTSYLYRHFLPAMNNTNAIDIRDINVVWREKICQWSYNVVDHFDLSREVVAVSLNLLDRYFATLGNKYNGNMALLASLTTLHIAIKLYDIKKIKLSTLANLSRGQFNAKDIEIMEWAILSALQWKLHPPTSYAFVEHMLYFLPEEVNGNIRKGLNEVSKYLTELAICDSYFVDRASNSTIAFAAILNVMEDMKYSKFPSGLREAFLRNLAYHIDMYHCSEDVVQSRRRLRKMFAVSSTIHGSTTATPTTDANCVTPHDEASTSPPTSPGQENYGSDSVCGDAISLTDRTMSTGSVLSTYNNHRTTTSHHTATTYRSRTNSVDTSKSGTGSNCRYSHGNHKPSPQQRANFFASVSPIITSSRAAASTSMIIDTGVQ